MGAVSLNRPTIIIRSLIGRLLHELEVTGNPFKGRAFRAVKSQPRFGRATRTVTHTQTYTCSVRISDRIALAGSIAVPSTSLVGLGLPATSSACQPPIPIGGNLLSFSRSVLYLLLLTMPAAAQAQAFATITIKPARSADPRNSRVQVLPNGDLKASAISVITLLSYAYGVPSNPSPRLNSLPYWTVGDRYDMEAKAPAYSFSASTQDGEAQARLQQMIRRLLADRFSLVMRVEQERMSAYALTVSGSGPKLEKSSVTTKDCIFDTAPEGCHTFIIGFGHPLNANAVSMDDLVCYIENWTDLPPVNRTNLSGLVTMHTQGWLPMRLPPPPPNGNGRADFSGLPTIFTVLGRLGLELHRQEEVLPVYTVERIDHPAVN
jgi:uncharacterized protein (TIGR03435 family)